MPHIAVAFLRTYEGSRFLEGISQYRREFPTIDLREIASLSDGDQEKYLLNQQVDGVITLTSDDRPADCAVLARFPGKVLNLSTELTLPGCSCLKWDLKEGLQLLSEHLKSIRANDLVYFGQNPRMSRQVMEENSWGFSSHQVARNDTIPGRFENLLPELKHWFSSLAAGTAIVCENGDLASLCIDGAVGKSWRIPHDLAIASLNGRQETLLACRPTITSIEQPYISIGYEAVRLMEQWLHRKDPPPPVTLMQGAQLVVRGSTRAYPEEIERALEYIEANAHRGITVLNVVRHTQTVSRVTFERNFKAAVSETPGEVIRRTKLQAGERILREMDCSVGEVAHRSGFESVSQFSLQFRRWKNSSPAAYRKLHRVPKSGDADSRDSAPQG